MGALGHYLEENGIPTTQISLIAEHTQHIKPPRALWVPFELGRPLGTPDHPQFQTRVLLAALRLLEAQHGPVLESFPEDAPEPVQGEAGETTWACPIPSSATAAKESTQERLVESLHREVAELRPWYDLGRERNARTAMATYTPEGAVSLLADYLLHGSPTTPPQENTTGEALRLAVQDLQTFYFEAASSRPDAGVPSSQAFDNWFWNETVAGKALHTVKEICMESADEELRSTATICLVPMPR